MTDLSAVAAVAAVAAIAGGLGLAAAARARSLRASGTLAALGFRDIGGETRAELSGRTLTARSGWITTPLAPAPLPYDVLARALGRGDLLAALHGLTATADDHLRLPLDPRAPLKLQRRRLAGAVALATALESLPLPEAMARWFLDRPGDADLAGALERLIGAYPDAPETLGACRLERDQPRDPRAAARARAHLERR